MSLFLFHGDVQLRGLVILGCDPILRPILARLWVEDILVELVVVRRADVRKQGPAGEEFFVAAAALQSIRLAICKMFLLM